MRLMEPSEHEKQLRQAVDDAFFELWLAAWCEATDRDLAKIQQLTRGKP